MKDWKLVLGVIVGSAVLVMVMIIGLSKMSAGGGVTADMTELINGALMIKENGNTKVTVVNFSDVQCPACKIADEELRELRNINGVKVVFRHFPLTIHANSQIGARAVEAARQLGKSWEMLDLLFDKQNEWSGEKNPETKFVEYAKSLGISEKDFQTALNSTNTNATVSADLALGDRLRLSGTPSIFVNGELTATDFVMDKVNQLLKQ